MTVNQVIADSRVHPVNYTPFHSAVWNRTRCVYEYFGKVFQRKRVFDASGTIAQGAAILMLKQTDCKERDITMKIINAIIKKIGNFSYKIVLVYEEGSWKELPGVMSHHTATTVRNMFRKFI